MAGQQQTDPMMTWMVVVIMLLGVIYTFWLAQYGWMGPALIYAKMAELYPLTFFSDEANATYQRMQATLPGRMRALSSGGGGAGNMWDLVMVAGKISGAFYGKAVGVLAIVLMFYSMFAFPATRFKNKFNLESMIFIQAKTWPVIWPFIKFNPAKQKSRSPGSRVPSELPIFAEALYPEEWMAYNRIRVVNGVPDRDQMRRALMSQLGDRFEGIDTLPEYIYCLLAAFALKGARKRDASDTLLGEIAKCWTEEKGFVPSPAVKSTAAKALSDRKIVEPLLDVMGRHAYINTALLAVLSWARLQGGVLAPAQFVWLRGEDRNLWYPLNNMGRRSFHVEASGAMAHYQAEVSAGKAIVMPRLDAAVVAIAQYISETRAKIPEIEGGEAAPASRQVAGGRRDSLMLNKPVTKH